MRDKAWAERIIRGDRAAGERFVSQHYRSVYGMLRSLCDSREAAEDLTQQAFATAWQALPTYRGEAKLSTWLCHIAYHEYTHWLRARRGTVDLHAVAETADPLAENRLVAGLQTVLVAHALAQLTEDLRETFLLHYEQGFSVAEIAAILDVPGGTVKSRLFTARGRLRELLADALDDREAEPVRTRLATGAARPLGEGS